MAAKRAAGRKKGGDTRSGALRPAVLPPDTPDVSISTVGDVLLAVQELFNQTRRGEIDYRVSNCLAVLCQVQLKVLGTDDLEKRLDKVEDLLTQTMRKMNELTFPTNGSAAYRRARR
jgi:hypothetical protein